MEVWRTIDSQIGNGKYSNTKGSLQAGDRLDYMYLVGSLMKIQTSHPIAVSKVATFNANFEIKTCFLFLCHGVITVQIMLGSKV